MGLGVPSGEPDRCPAGGQRLQAGPTRTSGRSEFLRRLVHGGDAPLAHRVAGRSDGRVRPRGRLRVMAGLGGARRSTWRRGPDSWSRPELSASARFVFSRAEEEMPLPADVVDLPGDGGTRCGGSRVWCIRCRAHRDRSAPSTTSITWATAPSAHRLDIIRRRTDPPAEAPVFIYIHGGAWVMGNKREQGLPLLYELARRGWVTVTINYRLSPKATWPDHIVDCKRAVAWVRDHIAEYGGDPRFVTVSGGSAGGHLAALLALTPRRPRVSAGVRRRGRVGRRVRAVLRRLRHDGGAGHFPLRQGIAHVSRAPGVQAPVGRRPVAIRGGLAHLPGDTPRHLRSSFCTAPTTLSCRWQKPTNS